MLESEEARLGELYQQPQHQISYLTNLINQFGRHPYLLVRITLTLTNSSAPGVARVAFIKVTLHGDCVGVR